LNTVIADFRLDANSSLTLETQRLLESREIKRRVAERGLAELTTPLGVSTLSKHKAASAAGSRTTRFQHLRAQTLQDLLNALARTDGKAVWHYEQMVCGGKPSFRISWSM